MEKRTLKVNKELFLEKAKEKFGKSITQQEIAEKMGVDRSRLYTVLNGKNLSTVEFVKSLCDLVGLKLDDLISYEGEETSKVDTSPKRTKLKLDGKWAKKFDNID